MLGELLHPGTRDDDPLLLGVVLRGLVPVVVGLLDHVRHVLAAKSGEDAEEEFSLRQLVGQLLLGGQVLDQDLVLHGVLVHVLDGELLVVRYFQMDHLVGLQVQLALLEDVPHEVEGRGLHRRQEDAN